QEAWWQPARSDIQLPVRAAISEPRRIAGGAVTSSVQLVFADGRKPMVGRDEHVRRGTQAGIRLQEVEDLLEIGVGIGHRGARRGPVDTGLEMIEAVSLVVLGAVRIA